MTVEQLVKTVNENLGLIATVGGGLLFVLVVWLRKHFYSRKDGEKLECIVASLETRTGALEVKIDHLPTPQEVTKLGTKLTKVEGDISALNAKIDGIADSVERTGAQNDMIWRHLLTQSGTPSLYSGD